MTITRTVNGHLENISSNNIFALKDAFSDLRQLLVTKISLKMIKKYFLFQLRSSFLPPDI